ncbi:MAG: (Fe-S)-binding protein [Acidimicrobiales bacterium]
MSAGGVGGTLGLDPDGLATCVSCGLCLAHCPTYRVTGEEGLSPRGRISAMRAVTDGAPADPAFERLMRTCVQCRACETACPSSVPFGRLMETTRSALAGGAGGAAPVPWWQRGAYWALGHHRLLLGATAAGALAQRARLIPPGLARRLAMPRLPLRQAPLRSSGTDVWLFTGCVMDAWNRPVHAAVAAVIEATGAGVAFPGPGGACCGALHVHAGLEQPARRLAERVMAALPGSAPVLVDSAGCGAALKDYGHLVGTPEAEAFSARVLDVHEWLAARMERLPPARRPLGRVIVQDPCHLRHVQRCEAAVRSVLRPYAEIVELDDEGRCCGAGGAYSVLQPELAKRIRIQKLAAIQRAGAPVVASANPGCALWLAAAGLSVRHPVELVAAAAGLLKV